VQRFAIPEDAAAAGFDDLPIAVSVTLNLTTVSYRCDSIAASAAAEREYEEKLPEVGAFPCCVY